MTENFSTGDILQLQDTHCTKGMGTTLATVLAIIGAIIVLALVWGFYTRARDTRANTEAIASGALGTVTGTVNGIQDELRVVRAYERNDAIKIAHMDGSIYHPFCGGNYGHAPFYNPGFDHGCGHDCCGSKQQFREEREFAETSDVVKVISTCGSRA